MNNQNYFQQFFPDDSQVRKIVGHAQKVLGPQSVELMRLTGIEPEDMFRFMPLAEICRWAREKRGLSPADAARGLKLRQKDIKAIEGSIFSDIDPLDLTRYLEFLGLSDFFEAWAAANSQLAGRLRSGQLRRQQPPVPRLFESLLAAGEPACDSELESLIFGPTAAVSRGYAPGTMDKAVYQLKVTLKHSSPAIWRRVQVPSTLTLLQLHEVLQIVMGWDDCHLHQFMVREEYFGQPDPEFGRSMHNEKKIRLGELGLREKNAFTYEYDFGDSWDHRIVLEKKVPLPIEEEFVPRCIKGANACPPEDSGGVWGYEQKLAILRDPRHPEHEETAEWMGEGFDPAPFDLEMVNGILQQWHAANRRRSKSRKKN